MTDLTALLSVIQSVEKAGPWAIVGLMAAALLRGELVLRRELDAMRAQRDEWRDIALPVVRALGQAVEMVARNRERGGAP